MWIISILILSGVGLLIMYYLMHSFQTQNSINKANLELLEFGEKMIELCDALIEEKKKICEQ